MVAYVYMLFRLLGWWSIDEGSKEEQARLFYTESNGYIIIEFSLFIRVHVNCVDFLNLLLFVIASNVYKLYVYFPFFEGTTHSQATHLR